MPRLCALLALVAAALLPGRLAAQADPVWDWAVLLSGEYGVSPNVTYLKVGDWEGKLDVYRPSRRAAPEPVPTVIFFHGGGWIRGDKEGPVLHVFPYIAMGWAVVNVEYRMAPTALAPAAVQDGRCALRWVWRNARERGFDTTRIVVTGHSAGGHLALTTGMLRSSDGYDDLCPGPEEPRVAAIVNWYGITDVNDVLAGPNQEAWAVTWLGDRPEKEELARRLSPLSYARRDLPPILTLHGDKDTTVPHTHAVRLDQALTRAGATHQLLTLPGVGHGGLNREQLRQTYGAIRDFLARHGIRARTGG